MQGARSQQKARGSGKGSEGYTLLELLIVLAVLALIAGIAVPQLMKSFGHAKADTAKLQVDALASSLHFYKLDVGSYPSQAQGLKALVEAPSGVTGWNGPYVTKKSSLIDPWGNAYVYKHPGTKGEFEVYSLGSDGKEGGDGEARDVSSAD